MTRTRFAPSPTGFMHVGGVRTALFAWLIAQKEQGTFILRIEDTDKAREVEGSITQIEDSLRWLGIDWQEGIDKGGDYGPYLQSERLDIYKEWAHKLIANGRAYADPYTQDQLQQFRDEAKRSKQPFLYRNHRPDSLDSEPPEWDGAQPLRFKSDPNYFAHWSDNGPINDEVMGELTVDPDTVDDFILIKSDGYPTYNFAHVIDDHLMKISHVIRGQEFISSMPNYLDLYSALDIERPKFAHLPHVLNEQGNKKLGKRDGAKDILTYGREGYLPETLLSFIATLGWNDGTEQEIFTRDELIKKFSLSRVQKSGAHFDEKRLLWMNGQFIRELSIEDLLERVKDFWPTSATGASDEQKKTVLALVQDRLKTLADLPIITSYFFEEPTPDWAMIDDNKQLKKLEKTEIADLLTASKTALSQLDDFTPETIQQTLNQLLETTGQKPGILFSLIRLAVSWAPFSPALNDTLAVLGNETTLSRLDAAIQSLDR